MVKDLEDANTYACNTIRVNRGQCPDNFKLAKLDKGSSLFVRYQNLIAVRWKDKSDVFILSLIHGNGVQTIERYSGDIKNSNGVEKSEQYLSYNVLPRKSIKWWKKVF